MGVVHYAERRRVCRALADLVEKYAEFEEGARLILRLANIVF
jgi:hypothetical protein